MACPSRAYADGLSAYAWLPEQFERVEPDPLGDSLDALEREVTLAALYTSDVGPVDLEQVGECLLAQAVLFPVGPQVVPDGSLQVAFHAGKASVLLLDSLQTYR